MGQLQKLIRNRFPGETFPEGADRLLVGDAILWIIFLRFAHGSQKMNAKMPFEIVVRDGLGLMGHAVGGPDGPGAGRQLYVYRLLAPGILPFKGFKQGSGILGCFGLRVTVTAGGIDSQVPALAGGRFIN